MPKLKRRKVRPSQVIGFRAFEDADQDILTWWRELQQEVGPSKRSDVLRRIIREHLESLDSETVDTAAELARLTQVIEGLVQQVTDLSQRVARGVDPAKTDHANGNKDESEFTSEYKQNVLKRKW